jgi:hypothetical protein
MIDHHPQPTDNSKNYIMNMELSGTGDKQWREAGITEIQFPLYTS